MVNKYDKEFTIEENKRFYYTTKCEHKFCKDCYKKIAYKNSCPLCRGKLWGNFLY